MPVRSCKIILLCLGILSTVFSCANIVRPSGGDKDNIGPKMIGVVPHPGSRNFMGKEVVFYFNEYLKPGNYAKEVFISPIPSERPTITVFNKRLTVRFNGPLRENTTYVITLGADIKDFNEGNKMAESFTYAFSTGDELDTLEVSGNISSAWGNLGLKEMTVMLFPAEELASDSIFGKQPVYALETDKKGDFRFRYLAEGKYRIYAVRDADNDFSFSQAKEELALTEQPLIDLSDSATRKKPIIMRSFQQDDDPVRVKSARWSNDNVIHIEFNDVPRDTFADRILKLVLQDSTGARAKDVETMRFLNADRKHLFFVAPHSRTESWDIAIINLMDSLGNQQDTVVRLQKESISKEEKALLFTTPFFSPERNGLVLPSLHPVPGFPDTSKFHLIDSTGKRFSVNPVGSGLELLVHLNTLPDPKMEYRLIIDSSFVFSDGKGLDSSITIKTMFPDPLGFGSIEGMIVGDSSKPGMHYVVILTGPPFGPSTKKEKARNWSTRIEGPGHFFIDYMPAGKYTVQIIEDQDMNGYLTPGGLFPYRMPEKMLSRLAPIEIKGNWDMKNHKIVAVELAAKKGSFGKAKGVDEGEDNEEGEDSGEENEDQPVEDK